ncbi:major histocompatibility complex class I-related gene protein-like [Morone saxatilis]|uniref:major histocompatibility complex class I-related gene protein-like n=1 Tax=Morone saxatilis TaxID=34816 RepID=UPI0015E1EAB5|nr:major histocompatibility complex class I-related gene protein-like [Morone saxatilis]
MKTFILLSVLLHFAIPVKHSLKYILTSSYGVRGVPQFVAVAVVDEVPMAHCDSNRQIPRAKTDWMERFFKEKIERLQWYTNRCTDNEYDFKDTINSLMSRFNQTGGVHIFQRMNGCEWDDETGNTNGFNQYGYDGEDFLAFDQTTLTWIAPKPQAVITKHKWDRNIDKIMLWKNALNHKCIQCLKEYVEYAKTSLQRTGRITRPDTFPQCLSSQKTPLLSQSAATLQVSTPDSSHPHLEERRRGEFMRTWSTEKDSPQP